MPRTFFGFPFMNGALTSTMPNFTFGNRFATAAVVSDIRNPTAIDHVVACVRRP